ncbi:hypothetical protein S245_043528, partial [Arachis hypogaea]
PSEAFPNPSPVATAVAGVLRSSAPPPSPGRQRHRCRLVLSTAASSSLASRFVFAGLRFVSTQVSDCSISSSLFDTLIFYVRMYGSDSRTPNVDVVLFWCFAALMFWCFAALECLMCLAVLVFSSQLIFLCCVEWLNA